MRFSKFRPAILATLLFAAPLFAATSARADDQPFVTLYTTDVDTQGEREAEQWLTWGAGHAHGSYGDFFSQSELEYGVTDDFQAALYLDYDWTREHIAPGAADTSSLVAVHGEFIYRVLNVYFDPFGLAFYLEPSEGPGERGVETKILLQKNFLNDTLRFAFNANFEDDWTRTPGQWAKTSALEFDAGLAYNITPDFSAGMEFDNERAYEGLVLGSAARERTAAFFIGPTIQYVGQPATITLGAQTQLPWAENPSHTPGATGNGFVANAERYRITLRLSKDF